MDWNKKNNLTNMKSHRKKNFYKYAIYCQILSTGRTLLHFELCLSEILLGLYCLY